MMTELMLFGGLNPMEWVIILAVILLLFGGSRLPQLAKALGQSKRAFREGQEEAEEEARLQKAQHSADRPSVAAISDEELFEEARRRAAQLRAADGSRVDDRLLSEKDTAPRAR